MPAPNTEVTAAPNTQDILRTAALAAFNDKAIQGLRRAYIGAWITAYAAELDKSAS